MRRNSPTVVARRFTIGITAFTKQQQSTFLREFDARDLPPEINRNDKPAVQAWLLESFGDWLTENREELLAKEWVRRGWAKIVLAPDDSGHMCQTCQVRPEHKAEVDAWMVDQLD